MPGHYFLEGMITSQYKNDDTPILPSSGSAYDRFLSSKDRTIGTAEEWVEATFVDWSYDHLPYLIVYMFALMVCSRIVTYIALTKLDYRAN